MEQVIFGGLRNPSSAATKYTAILGGSRWETSEFRGKQVVSTSGKMKNLRIVLDTAPGAGKSFTFTLMLNGSPSALEVIIADVATSGSDMVNEIDVVAGDTISLRSDPTNSPATIWPKWASMFEGATAKESLTLGTTVEQYLNDTLTRYNQVSTGRSLSGGTQNNQRQICPTSGKMKNFYVQLSQAPGAGKSYTFMLRVAGADTALVVSVSDTDTDNSNVADEVTVSAGDVLTLKVTPSGTPASFTSCCWGITFVADIDGESILLAGVADSLNTSDPEYNQLQSAYEVNWGTIESEKNTIGQSCTLKKLHVLLNGTPGAGKSYTFNVRVGESVGNVTVTIADTDITGSDLVNTHAIVNDDFVGMECSPANTPSGRQVYWGLVGYIAPAVTGIQDKSANMAAKMMARGMI